MTTVDGLPPYVPPPRWSGGHRMTLYCWARPRRFPRLPAPLCRYFDVAPGVRVQGDCYWQPTRRGRPVLVALHGLEGSSVAHYMLGLADKAWARGWNVVLLNQRNCGGTEHLCEGLYHSGLTDDARAVLTELAEVDGLERQLLAGYSLGGNLTLKLAGEAGADGLPTLKAAAAVSPTMDLAVCVDALERRENRLYEWNFVRNLKARMRRKAACWPGRYDLGRLSGVRTLREFDERYTAPHHGFASAGEYYSKASSIRVIARIARPTLIVTAADDPVVPPAQFDVPDVARNGWITRIVTREGGHCGFFAAAPIATDHYWAEHVVLSFLAASVEGQPGRATETPAHEVGLMHAAASGP